MKRKIILTVFVIILVVGLLIGCNDDDKKSKPPAPESFEVQPSDVGAVDLTPSEEVAEAKETCEKSGGIDCQACCEKPIGSSNIVTCCEPNSCVKRKQFTTTYEGLGEVTIEQLPDGNYGVWYGEKTEEFGNRPYVDAVKIGVDRYQFTVDQKNYEFSVEEFSTGATGVKCGIIAGGHVEQPDCVEDLSCEEYFVLLPTNQETNPWSDGLKESQEVFEQVAQVHFEFFRDISHFKFKNVGLILVPLDFVQENCDVGNLPIKDRQTVVGPSGGTLAINVQQRIRQCADAYTQRLGVTYTRAAGLIFISDAGFTNFGSKVVYSSHGFVQMTAHEFAHTYFLCDEYSSQLYQQQNSYIAGVGGCRNSFPTQCIKEPPNPECLGSSPVFREYSGSKNPLPYAQEVCSGNRRTSVMGAISITQCGYDITGGYDAIR